MITSGLMSSLTDEWETPQDLFDKYDCGATMVEGEEG